MALRVALLSVAWPAAFGLLLEFVKKSTARNERGLLRSWIALVMADVAPEDGEQFFIGLRALGGKLMLDDARYSQEGWLSSISKIIRD